MGRRGAWPLATALLEKEVALERWRTASKNDADFARLLDGTFSSDHRALPRRSLNVGGPSEEATFEIVPLAELERPHPLAIALHSLRPETLALSLGPLIATAAYVFWLRLPIDLGFAALAFLGVLLFHASLNLLNDYADHLSGADRVNALGGSRAIQRGWARAISFRRWGLVLFGLALADGLAVSSQRPLVLLPLGVCALGAGYYLTRARKKGARLVGAREAAAFALGGPLLICGFTLAAVDIDLAANAEFALRASTLALSYAFGFSALLYAVLGQFEGLMQDSLAGTGTLASRLGFDRAKRLIAVAAIGPPGATLLLALSSGAWIFVLPAVVLATCAAGWAARRALTARSPLSSSLRGIRNRALLVHWALAVGLSVGFAASRFWP